MMHRVVSNVAASWSSIMIALTRVQTALHVAMNTGSHHSQPYGVESAVLLFITTIGKIIYFGIWSQMINIGQFLISLQQLDHSCFPTF